MKIFLSFLQSKVAHPIPAYSFWEYYLKNGIAEAGHEWVEADIDWAYGIVPKTTAEQEQWKANAWQKTIEFLEKNRVELFLGYLFPQQIDVPAIRQIQSAGVPCVNFFCDTVRFFGTLPPEFLPFSLNWVPEYKALSRFREAGAKSIHLPMPMWVHPDYRVIKPEQNERITFIGSWDIQRQLLLEEIIRGSPGLPLDIYGAGWKTTSASSPSCRHPGSVQKILNQFNFLRKEGFQAYKRKLDQRVPRLMTTELEKHLHAQPGFADYIRLIQESRIVMGINRYPSFRFPLDHPDTYSRLRDIEAPMLGTCYLTENTAGLEQLYEFGRDILVYKDSDEFTAQVKRANADKSLRDTLRTHGQRTALEEHSITAALKKIRHVL